MSAYLVSNEDLSFLASYALSRGIHCFPEQAVKLLHAENGKSLRARYADADVAFGLARPPVFGEVGGLPSDLPVRLAWIVKACNHYDYQACEHEGYRSSAAAALVDNIREDALGVLGVAWKDFYKSKAYEAAPWGVDYEVSFKVAA
jgi:hypothetical protein